MTEDPFKPIPAAERDIRQTSWYSKLCLQRMDAIRLIPDAKPRLALQALRDLVSAWARGEELPFDVPRDEATGVGTGRGEFEREVITPAGARLLKRAFEAGLIPQRSRKASQDLSSLDAYIASEARLVEDALAAREAAARQDEARESQREALRERSAHLAAHPEDARPEEINRQLVNEVIIRAKGLGRSGEIELAGFLCCKRIHRSVSNRGNAKEPIYEIWWIGPDGVRFGDEPYEPVLNRQSDPKRNWGLGRE